jgi:hypothetical protein
MIDRERRDKFAELLRHFVAGRMSNYAFSDQILDLINRTADRGIKQVYWEGAWGLFDDLHEHYMKGKHDPNKEVKRIVARWITFLYSNYEYEWPFLKTTVLTLVKALTSLLSRLFFLLIIAFVLIFVCIAVLPNLLGGLVFLILLAFIVHKLWFWKSGSTESHKYPDFWPFISQQDLDEARKHPRLL